MGDNKATAPRVLLNRSAPPDYIPPPLLSDRQVTLCPKVRAKGFGLGFVNFTGGLVECPGGDYDLYDFVQQSEQIADKEFDLVVVWTSSFDYSNPFNTKKFGCPTVLLAGDTHHWEFPINHLLAYWATEGFDYVATAYNRQHLHWFAAAGVENLAWMSLISMRCFSSRSCPEVIAADLLDLRRLELYVEESFADPYVLVQQRGVPERVHELTGEPASWPGFDVAVCAVRNLQRLGQPLKANFAFVLEDNHQLVFANAEKITETFLIDLIQKDSSAPSAWLRGYEGVEYKETVANLSRLYKPTASLLPEVKVVVDVGAIVGVASACFRTFHAEAVIHCFEVDPLALHLLQQSALILGNCRLHPVSLAGQNSYKTRRLWPEDTQAKWGVEQVLTFREAKAALQELGLERIDVLGVAICGQEVEVLTSLEPWLKDIKVIYVEFYSEQDCKQIDRMLDPSRSLWQGEVIASQRGSLCYLNRAYLPDEE